MDIKNVDLQKTDQFNVNIEILKLLSLRVWNRKKYPITLNQKG